MEDVKFVLDVTVTASSLPSPPNLFLQDWRLYVSLEEYYSFVTGIEGRYIHCSHHSVHIQLLYYTYMGRHLNPVRFVLACHH